MNFTHVLSFCCFILFIVFFILFLTLHAHHEQPITDRKLHKQTANETSVESWQRNSVSDFGMITIDLKGGLGNQLFMIANGYAYGRKHGKVLVLDHSMTKTDAKRKTYFGSICSWVLNQKLVTIPTRWIPVREAGFHYTELPFFSDNLELRGYFQSAKYFDTVKEEVVRLFRHYMSKPANVHFPTPSVSVHVRRGDYLTHTLYHILQKEYYVQALQYLSEKTPKLTLVLFSEDLAWCRAQHFERLECVSQVIYMGDLGTFTDEQEMWLMSECDHHIIANSSFSWWGAFLDVKPSSKTVAPQKWFTDPSMHTQDLYPQSWLVI